MARGVRSRIQPVGDPTEGRVREVAADAELTDADLVARACRDDRWAEETIYRRHVAYIGWLVTRLLGRHDEAEDVLQETFTIALEQLHTLRDGAALRAWLTQIAVSRVRRRFQRRRLLRVIGLDRGQDDATLERLASDDCSPEVRADLASIGRVLETLAAHERIAWTLHCVEGMTLEEAARACDCSLATVKRRIAAADRRVKIFVSDLPWEGESP